MKKIIKRIMGWDHEYFPNKSVDEKLAELRRDTIYLEKRIEWLIKRVEKLEDK